MSALFQCMMRGIDPGPIHTYKGWQELGRQVKKGEKAIILTMPVTVSATQFPTTLATTVPVPETTPRRRAGRDS